MDKSSVLFQCMGKKEATEGGANVAKPELTKRLIADTLKELMQHTPLDKISVQSIVEACGINRKTFYYHFRDKQALVCWIFDTECEGITDLNNNNTAIDELLEHLYQNKQFYVAALTSDAQNNLRDHFFDIVYRDIRQKVLRMLGDQTMADGKATLISRYFTHAIVGSIAQWARDGMQSSPNEYNIDLHPLVEGCLEYTVQRYKEPQ